MQHKNCSDKKFRREPIIVNENIKDKSLSLISVKLGLCKGVEKYLD
jgi:hypothetical protein